MIGQSYFGRAKKITNLHLSEILISNPNSKETNQNKSMRPKPLTCLQNYLQTNPSFKTNLQMTCNKPKNKRISQTNTQNKPKPSANHKPNQVEAYKQIR